MKQLLNTLYVMSESAYLTLDGETWLQRRRGGKLEESLFILYSRSFPFRTWAQALLCWERARKGG